MVTSIAIQPRSVDKMETVVDGAEIPGCPECCGSTCRLHVSPLELILNQIHNLTAGHSSRRFGIHRFDWLPGATTYSYEGINAAGETITVAPFQYLC
jgi:hypothetical protein